MVRKLKKQCKTDFLYHFFENEKIMGKNPKMHHAHRNELNGDCVGLWGDCSGLRGECTGLMGLWGECSNLIGDCSGLRGDCSGLRGDCSGLTGDCSELRGNCSNIFGDCSDLSGNIDCCEITDEERKKGVKIEDLVCPDKSKNYFKVRYF